ncbi:hypothetical protein BD324DRAFT_613233 [Kockovaella imperatae]|uniref:Uncharacterized protein n=1 Tax=Kockovaella imperatae TaxID=4999 RepID=A0A1Y1USW6_9TREE|nr:hypothetical protein BD324DRAFT_613233 [Kockovaella imperatae]ORX41113.1 hypothetical protein BD324DRAFT_613233 [Kockovaella imperatae]
MTDSPPSSSSSSHPLYSLPHLNRSASSYNSAENGIPDGPEVDGSTYAALVKNSPSVAEPPLDLHDRDPGTARFADQGAIDLGDDDLGRYVPSTPIMPRETPQRVRGSYRTDSDDGGMGSILKSGNFLPPSATLGGTPATPAQSGLASLTPQKIGKSIGNRIVRAVRRGNLPFLVVFLSCLVIFFSALAGIGYVPEEGELAHHAKSPRAVVSAVAQDLQVFNGKKFQEQRELEQEWAKKKRPKDGAWMAQVRDDKAVRRRPNAVAEVAETPSESELEAKPEEAV